ncbi:MAG: M15 family peptidase [Magnetococcales bacterium]|nr:M15 family peptidase [Magnetococcales bacterium]
MPKFSKTSLKNLSQCDHHLQILFGEVIKKIDCTVVCGHRGKTDQDAAYLSHRSQVRWPESKHNRTPSLAVDVVPCIGGKPSWEDHDCYLFSGKVMGYVNTMNMEAKIRCGADWNGNGSTRDQELKDSCHFEMI